LFLVGFFASFAQTASVQIYGMLTSTTGKDLSTVFKADLNVEEGKTLQCRRQSIIKRLSDVN
jgi:hypothetical protein